MKEKSGVVYILINPSFPEYVKIGYADNVNSRLAKLNKSECIPFAFRVYATYEVSSRLSDKKIHGIIDKLNPNLRAIDSFEGKKRVREFYAMTPEDAYDLLKSIAELNGLEKNLKLSTPNKQEIEDEKVAQEISQTHRNENFSFAKCSIPVGANLEYINDKSITCKVVDDRHVEFKGQTMFLSGLAKVLLNKNEGVNGTRYFKYNDKDLQWYYEKFQSNKK